MTSTASAQERIDRLLNPLPAIPSDPDTWHMPPLEDIQESAAAAAEGPLIIMGGAGTGKSQVLLARAVKLVQAGASPSTITTITFNARASRRIAGRLQSIIGGDPHEAGFFTGTLHSYCSAMLRQAGWRACNIQQTFSIWDQEQSLTAIQQIVGGEDGEASGWLPVELHRLLEWISRNSSLRPEDQIPPPSETWFDYAEQYVVQKREQNSLDFTDLLVKAREALTNDRNLRTAYSAIRTRHLIVDEFQDLTALQYNLIKLMAGPTRSVTVAIDPNQSVYQWRGAAPDLLQHFQFDFPNARVCGLSLNHRTSASVMRSWRHMAQHAAMTGLVDDYQRALRPAGLRPEERAIPGQPDRQYRQIAQDIKQMIDTGDYKAEDFAVLCRTKRALREVKLRIDAAGLHYNVIGEDEPEKDGDAQAIIAMLTLATNPHNVWALRKGADCNVRSSRRNLNHKITRHIQRESQSNGITLPEAAERIREQLDPSHAIHAELTYAINTHREITEMLAQDAPTSSLIQRVHDRMYEAYTGRRQLQMNPEVLKLIALADRSDRESDRRATTEQRCIAFLERLANATEPDQESDQSDDPTRLRHGVTLATMHVSKGLQWPVVMITDVAENVIPGDRAQDGSLRMEEAQRLLYVAVTRAEDVFYLYWSEMQEDGTPAAPSRFMDAMMLKPQNQIIDTSGDEDDDC